METAVYGPGECSAFLSPPELLQHRPQLKYHPGLSNSIHTHLQVCDEAPGSSPPEQFRVMVVDPSKANQIPIILKSSDTTDDLMEKYLKERPEPSGPLHLAFNGQLLPAKKSVRELGVKPGSMFITFQRCTGG